MTKKAVTFTVQIDDQLAQALDQVRKALQEVGYDPR